ncbi:MAG: site-specific integrase, partial [Cyanobacteriota bacterium]|nr:site-specific integrase [Cyanobacteriota bacterium]
FVLLVYIGQFFSQKVVKMDEIQDKVFIDFEVPATSDGSYEGRKKIIEATDKHLKMKFEQELAEVNQRLKLGKTKVRLFCIGGSIQLRATLPLKPGETHKQGRTKKQYYISLAIPANFDGLKTAEEEGYELGKLIARKTFTWTDKYLGIRATKDKGITFNEFYNEFEKRYFQTRKRTIRSENSLRSYKEWYRSYFLDESIINESNIKLKVESTKTPHARKTSMQLAKVICKMLNLTITFENLRIIYKPQARSIPDDQTIIRSIELFEERSKKARCTLEESKNSWKLYKLIYSLLAIYGLRPREVLNNPDLEWFMSSENEYNTFKVHESNKTGYREVFPFVPEWVELFDVKNQENIELLKKRSLSWKTSTELKNRIKGISNTFKICNIPFVPYDLRHACAIRAHLQGLPIKAAADNLGHGVKIHTKTYQQWFGLENRRKAFSQTFAEQYKLERLENDNIQLHKRVSELELENTRLKQMLNSQEKLHNN